MPTLTEGTIIAGRYRVTRRLGSGGFANIYLVTDSEDYLQEEIVLKLVDENLMRELLSHEGEGKLNTHDDLIRAWRSKLKAWKVISEQEPGHIVRLLGVPRIIFEHERSYGVGMLMEYMPGGDLWQYFQKHGAPRSREQLTEMMRLFLSACRAVAVLHANRLLHRDIKPSNFLLNLAWTQCKLSDFELIMEADERAEEPGQRISVGTLFYMAPECFDAQYSIQSDIYALGAMLYHLLTGEHPRSRLANFHMSPAKLKGHRPTELTRLNPLVSAELNEAVLWCLDDDPAARPASVGELQDELIRLGLTGDAVNIAPVNLARLLLTHLPEDDVQDLVESLEENGFHSASAETDQRQRDIIEEYCYTASPYDVLKDNCTTRQLKALTKSLGLKGSSASGRDDLIEEILTSVGFLASAREVPGIEATRTFLENLRLNLAHATTMDECVGMVQAGLSAVERTVDLLLSFYGQLLLGTKLPGFLKKAGNGKPPGRLTFGEKLGALRRLCSDSPSATLPNRIRKVFKFPLIAAEVFDRLGEVVKQRNLSAHSPHESTRRSLALTQRSGRQLLEHAVACLTELAQNTNVPRVVQIVSRQDDIYGRHFYLGRDDHGRSERIFTPLPLNVGRLYLFFPLTNPARINPLIFPFETHEPARGR
ncbi:MAG TPA: serine/threonine-protein kinase [Pyrinomonadaceae bacterium]|jgi:serine/threonine protein kinase